jgi:hypothetical protein
VDKRYEEITKKLFPQVHTEEASKPTTPKKPPSKLQKLCLTGTMDAFVTYMKEEGKAQNTIVNYKRNLIPLLIALEQLDEESNFSVAKLFTSDIAQPPTLINEGHVRKFIEKLTPASGIMVVKAMNKFLDFYESHQIELKPNRPREFRNLIKENVADVRTVMIKVSRRLTPKLHVQTMNNRREQFKSKSLKVMPSIVFDMMRKIIKSESVNAKLTNIAENGRQLIKTNAMSPTEMRNVIHALLLITTGGHRGSAIRGVTLIGLTLFTYLNWTYLVYLPLLDLPFLLTLIGLTFFTYLNWTYLVYLP